MGVPLDLSPRSLGGWRGRRVWTAEDFDAPLPAEILAAFDGGAG